MIGGVGDRLDEQLVDWQLAEQPVVEALLGLRHPVDEPVVASVVALQHGPHRRRVEPVVEPDVEQRDARAQLAT